MANPKLTDDQIREMVALREKGMTMREIGAIFGVNASTVTRAVRKYKGGGAAVGIPKPGEVGVVQNNMDVDGSVEVVTLDRPYTIKELAEMAGIDLKKYVPKYPKPAAWQGYYKLKGFVSRKVVEKLAAMARDGADVESIFQAVNHGALSGHQKVQLFGSKCTFERIMDESMEAAILEFARKHVGPIVLPPREVTDVGEPEMVSWGLWDAHLGAYAWRDEVGEDWDVNIAVRRILNSVDDMVKELSQYPIRRVLMPIGNDFLHFDNARQRTTSGEHHLDVDSRFARVYTAGLTCLCYMVEAAADAFGDVEIIYVPGNHDLVLSYTLCAVLAHRYMDDPRVRVDLGANPRKFRRHGGVLLGFDHGARSKPAQLALTFAQQAAHLWSGSTYREIQVGDKHQKWEKQYEGVIPTNGVLIRRHPALCNVDFWHHEQSLIGEPMKSVEAWRYDSLGCRSSHVVWACDEARKRQLPEMP